LPSEISSDGQAIAAIAHGDLGDEAEVAGDELRRRFRVLMLLIALGEHIFLLCREHRKLADFREIAVEARVGAKNRHNRGG
jgi:hypothetical protein